MKNKRIIQSYAGSGKTTYLKNYINGIPENESVLVIVSKKNNTIQYKGLRATVICF